MTTLAVQAGGRSSRMGQDKALKLFLGKPLIERVVDRLSSLVDEVIITANDPGQFPTGEWKVVKDRIQGKGPLGGLFTSLLEAASSPVLFVACDMPFVSPKLFRKQLEIFEETGADVVVPMSPEGFEPLHAVYRPEGCLESIREALNTGRGRLISWYSKVNVQIVSIDQVSLIEPNFHAFMNVNTKEEWLSAEKLAQSFLD